MWGDGAKRDLHGRAVHWSQPGHWNAPTPSQPSSSTEALRILGGRGCSPSPFFRPETELFYCSELITAPRPAHPVLCRSLDAFL